MGEVDPSPEPDALIDCRGLPVTVTFEYRWKMESYSLPSRLPAPLARPSSSEPASLL